jgi:hypothetical protein
MKTNKLIITNSPFAVFLSFLCLSCKEDNYHRSMRITPQIFPRSSTTGTQFRTRTKVKSPIPAEVIREIDTVVIRVV